MARKIKENGNNGERTAGQANIFVFLRARFALPYRSPTICLLFLSTNAFRANFCTRLQLFQQVRRNLRNLSRHCSRLFFIFLGGEEGFEEIAHELRTEMGESVAKELGEKIVRPRNYRNFV